MALATLAAVVIPCGIASSAQGSTSRRGGHNRPPGALTLSKTNILRVGGTVCGKVHGTWISGEIVSWRYFLSDTQQARNYEMLARHSKSRPRATDLKRASLYLRRAAKLQPGCTRSAKRLAVRSITHAGPQAVPAGAASPALTSSTATLYGFNDDAWQYNLQAGTGAPIRRMAIGWNTVQPTPTTWNWSTADAEVAALKANGLRPLIYLSSPPCWTHPANCDGTHDSMFLQDPTHDSAWSQFVARVARRYPNAAGIEIWNEENLVAYYTDYIVDPYTFIARYTQTVKLAHSAIAKTGLHIPVVIGGLFAEADTSSPYSDETFLAIMYQDGLRGNAEGIGTHPYPVAGGLNGTPQSYDPSMMEATLQRLRIARNAAGDQTTPLWITEVGESTWTGTPSVSETQQASDLITMLNQAKSDGDVRAFIIHRVMDYAGFAGSPIDAGFGVFRADGSPKPAACALSSTLGGTLHC